jgi:hypothetical protein
MCSLYRNEYRNFKLPGATIGRGLRRSEENRTEENQLEL